MSSFPTNVVSNFRPISLAVSRADETATRHAAIEAEVLALFDLMRSPLLRYTFSFSLSAADSEDVVQEVFLALFRHLQTNGSRSNLPAWLYRVAHNLALKRCMANRRSNRLFDHDETILPIATDPDPNPEDHLAFRQRQASLVAIVRALPEQDARCLLLRADGLKYREIAAILGISLGGVSISLTRSLARLRRGDPEVCR